MRLAWIPNVLTLGNLACGFVSLIFSSADSPERYTAAAVLILFAGLLDGLDGQVARRLGVDSPIGKELDSLADCVAFGVAPGFLAYKAYLAGFTLLLAGKPVDLGLLMAIIFPVCAAYRLARFNVHPSPHSFIGLPSPVAGIIVALGILCFGGGAIPRPLFAILFCLIAFLMVSTVGYSKPQSVILQNLQGLKLTLLVILVILLLFLFKFWVILLPLAVYILSGLLGWVIHFLEEHRY
jgi:CDP-diacylglycerol--serine O-phosphatidyltransferase